MKIKLIITSFLLLLSSIANAKITDSEAKKLVEDYVANKKGLENAIVYQAPDLLTKIKISLGDSIVMEQPSWCFFIDPSPSQDWQHKCKYARVSSIDGNMVVVTKTMPPVDWEKWNNTKASQSSLRSYNYTNWQVNYGLYSKNRTTKVRSNVYAVIISGGQSPNGRGIAFWNNASMTYQALREVYGVKKENIQVLMSGGVNCSNDIVLDEDKGKYMTSPKDLDGDNIWDVNDACTYTTVKNTLSNLSNKLTASDELFILLDTHGAVDHVALWDPLDYSGMTATQFKQAIAPIKAKMTIVTTACHGGSFLDDLKGSNRTVISSSRSNESSWMTAVSMFYEPFLAAGTGFYADDRLAFNDTNRDGKKQSSEYFDADADKNGSVSNIEAFAYALSNNTQDYSIYADSSWHEYPQCWASSVNIKAPITNGSGDIMSDGTIYASNKLNKAIIEYRSSKNIILQKGFSTKNTKFKGIKSSVLRSLNVPADLDEDEVFEYQGVTDIDDAVSDVNGIEIYPNPTDGMLYIRSNNTINKVIVTDMTGKVILDEIGGSNEVEIDLSSNAQGMYLLNVVTDNDFYVEKVVLK